MKKKHKVLEHVSSVEFFPKIKPSKFFIPDWYRKTGKIYGNKKNQLPLNLTFKACATFGDSFTSGYMLPLPVDIAVRQESGHTIITWNDSSLTVLDQRNPITNSNLPIPGGMSSQHFAWSSKNLIKLPNGYSALITHPLNRYDLPFITLSGIIDGGIVIHEGMIPVFFSKTFEGIIPAGTPIAQIIPFKTESWKNFENPDLIKESYPNKLIVINKAYGWYKQNVWKKKTYE